VNLALLGATVALLPLLVPRGPGNTAPVDLLAAAFLFSSLVTIVRQRRHVEVPAVVPLWLIGAGSFLALIVSHSLGVSLLTLLVDGYLLLLSMAVITQLQDDRRRLQVILVVWAVASVVWTTVILGAYFHLLPPSLLELLQMRANAKRLSGPTGDKPNLAASYLIVSFFVLRASPWPRRRLARWLAAGWLLLGVFATGSLGGFLGIVAGVAFLFAGNLFGKGHTPFAVQGLVGALLLALVLPAVILFTVTGVPRPSLTQVDLVSAQAQSGPLAYSVGRLDNSLNGRLALWTTALRKASPTLLTGIGPGGAKGQLNISNGSVDENGVLRVYSLHTDFLAFLIERGVLGLLGLVGLYAVLLRRSVLLFRTPGIGRLRVLGPAVVANIADSFFHETLHYRHVLLLFALLWAASNLPVTAIKGGPVASQVGTREAVNDVH
jgi:O-antigen ligase